MLTILDSILEGIQVLDTELRYLHVNEAAARHGRTSRIALLGRTLPECYPGIEQTEVYRALRQCLDDRQPRNLETRFQFVDGSVGWFELRIEPVPQGICVFSIEVTARHNAQEAQRTAEERLRRSQRLQAIGQLTAGIAHDFNNLLAVILAQGELSLARGAGPQPDDVDAMLDAARSAATLTRQLLAFGQNSVLRREVLDLGQVVRGVAAMLRRTVEARIELDFELDGPPVRVFADRGQLEQVLMNLVLNARDAIRDSGRITVAVHTATLDEEYVRSHPGAHAGPHAVLQVSDTGAGMDRATQARVFEPFFTTKRRGQGTGLGLATVYGIVVQHGGNVWLYSEPGLGTTFKVYLPVTERVPRRPAAPAPRAVPRLGGGRCVLVAEDCEPLARVFRDALLRAGFDPLLAADGHQAQALWSAQRQRIALLITDLMLPHVTGPALIEQFRRDRPDLPVLCTSGYADRQLLAAHRLPRDVRFLEKPFPIADLVDGASQLIAGAAAADGGLPT